MPLYVPSLVQLFQIFLLLRGQLLPPNFQCLINPLHTAKSDDRTRDPFIDPCQGDMTHLPSFLLSNFLHALNNLLVDVTIAGLRPVSRRSLGFLRRWRPCQNPAAERRPWNETDSRD